MAENVQVQPINPSVKKWIVISALLGYTALLIYLFYFVGIGELISVLETVNLRVYALVLISVVISITFHALVWFQLLSYVQIKLGFRRTYVLYWLGVFVGKLVSGGWVG